MVYDRYRYTFISLDLTVSIFQANGGSILTAATASAISGSYPSVIQAGRIMQLKRELTKAQQQLESGGGGGLASSSRTKGGASGRAAGGTISPSWEGDGGEGVMRRSRKDEMFIRDLAEKDYHLAGQLGQ